MNTTTINLSDFGAVIAALLIIGGLFKNAFPKFPNRFIPLLTWCVGVAAYLALSNGWQNPQQWVAAVMAAATATGIHSGVKNTFHRDAPASGNAGKVTAAIGTLFISGALLGCSTTSGKAIAATAQTVDAAMIGWAEYVATGKASVADENRVREAYANYQAAMELTLAVYDTSPANGDNTRLETAANLLRQNRAALIALINQLIPPK